MHLTFEDIRAICACPFHLNSTKSALVKRHNNQDSFVASEMEEAYMASLSLIESLKWNASQWLSACGKELSAQGGGVVTCS